MAVTTQNSTEYNKNSDPRTNGYLVPQEYQVPMFVSRFNFTQSGVGDSTSIQKLFKLPSGRVILFPKLSWIQWTAFGAARTLAIGVGAYTDENDATVAAAPTAFDSAIDVSAAGSAAMGSAMAVGTGGNFTYLSKAARLGNILSTPTSFGVDVIATVTGGAGIPDATTLKGYITYGILGAT